jgi:hypothetical protein
VLDADRQPHVAVRHAGRVLLFRRQLGMRRGGRMDREAAGVADVGDVIEQLQRVDEAPAGVAAGRELEADQPAEAALEIALGALAVDAGLHRRMDHPHHLGPAAQEVGDLLRVLHMAGDAQRQRLQPLDGQERIERRQRRADVAQQRDARLDDVVANTIPNQS